MSYRNRVEALRSGDTASDLIGAYIFRVTRTDNGFKVRIKYNYNHEESEIPDIVLRGEYICDGIASIFLLHSGIIMMNIEGI